MAHGWPEDNLPDSNSPFYHVDPRDRNVWEAWDRLLDLLSHFAVQFLLIY